jgi:exosome complex component RRP43
VRLGQTQVLAGITLQVGQPSVPNQGDVVVTDDKVLQSILLDAVDLTCLSIIDGKCAWRLVVTIQALQGDGNLWDARLLAAVAALTDVRLPKTQVGKAGLIEVIPKSEGTAIQFDYLPVPLTIGIHHDDTSTYLLADPTLQEEEFLQGHLTMVVNEENDIVHLVHAGGSLQRQDLAVCAHMAYGRGKEIRGLLSE